MIVLTAPTGSIGSKVLTGLLDSEEQIRVIVRDSAKLPEGVLDRVEVVQGSTQDADVLHRAFEGADALFWTLPVDHGSASVEAAYVDFTRPAAEALRAGTITHVVGVSALGRGTDQAEHAGYVTGSLAMDDLLADTGVAYRALANPSFMDNLLGQAPPIAGQGMFFSTIAADRKLPTCATADIAATAVGLLRDRSWTGPGEVPVLGPEDLSNDDMAQIMSEVLERPIRFQPMGVDAFKERLLDRGMSDAMAQGMVDMCVAKDRGLDEGVARTPENTTTTTFRAWCEAELKPAVLAAQALA